jgi:hypothetical protein
MVINLPTNRAGMFVLSAIVTKPSKPVDMKRMKLLRRPIMLDKIPPIGLMKIEQAICIAAGIENCLF